MRMGPLTLEARRYALATVLEVQSEIDRAAAETGRPTVDLINSEEQVRIEELIAAGQWPNGWAGAGGAGG